MASVDHSNSGSRALNKPAKPATIHEVAHHAGVSSMTASRAINGATSVSPALRERVLASAKILNYTPNLAARAARAGALRLGLLYSNPSAAYLNEFLVGALEQTGKIGGQLVLERCQGLRSQQEAIKRLIAAGVDGVLIPPPLCDQPAALRALKERRMPTVAVATARPTEGVAAVRIDDYAGAQAMTRRLLDLGHRDIAFIQGDPRHTPAQQRLEAFLDTMREAGIEVPKSRLAEGLFTYRSGLEAAENILKARKRPTAIFAANDDMAAGVLAIAHGFRLRVPEDLTVCGFDDTPVATTVWPALTTVHQPIASMARTAVEILHEEIRLQRSGASPAAPHRMLKFILIERGSSAAPRA